MYASPSLAGHGKTRTASGIEWPRLAGGVHEGGVRHMCIHIYIYIVSLSDGKETFPEASGKHVLSNEV